MSQFKFTREQTLATLQIMKHVATAGNQDNTNQLNSHSIEKNFLISLSKHIFEFNTSFREIKSKIPNHLEDIFTNLKSKQNLIELLVLIPFLKKEIDLSQVLIIEKIAKNLEYSSNSIDILHQIAFNPSSKTTLEVYRDNSSKILNNYLFSSGMREFILPILGIGVNEALKSKYENLQFMPRHSVGFSLWNYYQETKFPYPGVKGGFPSHYIAAHDLHHILLGCDTDDAGELEIIAFEAGLIKNDIALSIFPVLMQFQTSTNINANIGSTFNPDRFFIAWKSGIAVQGELLENWDYWSILPQSLEQVRKSYNIAPLSQVWDILSS